MTSVPVEIRPLGPGDLERVLEAADLFDEPPQPEWATRFLDSAGHHLLIAYGDDQAVGFVTGVETTHPDKGTEMFLYELGVDEGHRRRGIGRALIAELAQVAASRGCHGMWVATERDNAAAVATYRAAGSGEAEDCIVLSWEFP